jgi:hypothetical protein
MNKAFKIIFILLIYNPLFGQEFDLQKDNSEYLIKFDSTKDITDKIDLIKGKLLRDKIFIPDLCISTCNIEGYKFKFSSLCNKWKSQSGKECGKKILHYIFYKKGKEMIQLEEAINPNSLQILDILSKKNIDKIINFDSKMSAVFGSNAEGTNTIVIYTNDRTIKKIIKEFRKLKNGG